MFATSSEAETAFYTAFSQGDIDVMMAVWADGVDLCCIHPQGPRLTDRADIRRSWVLILSQPVVRRFDLRARLISGSDDFRIHQLEEHISVPGTRFVAPAVLATNVYQRINNSWHMVIHHGSVAPPPATGKRPDAGNDTAPSRLH